MFIFNVKLSRTKIFKGILAIMAIICLSIAGVGIFKIWGSNQKVETFGGDCMPSVEIAYLTDENYTNVLKEVHENLDTYIVGFLCSLENAEDFDTYSWIKITGTIEKGYYFGDIPCVQISEIEKTTQPENCVIPPPNDNFIQTSTIY